MMKNQPPLNDNAPKETVESQYIFNDGKIKSRLIRQDDDWYVAEYKNVADVNAEWIPWICGTVGDYFRGYDKNGKKIFLSNWLQLTEKDKEWAIDRRKQ
jgi:hypothetical protein